MRIFIVDDDMNVIRILKLIIGSKNLGDIVGFSVDGTQGIKEILALKPDIVIVDLLMPGIDGISLVNEVKKQDAIIQFIMISQVNSKDIIEKAYKSGVEFYINKPINAIEVENILGKVIDFAKMNNALKEIQSIFNKNTSCIPEKYEEQHKEEYKYIEKLKLALQRIGIISEIGSEDIIHLVDYVIKNNINISQYIMKDLCIKFSDNPKSMEQRIRRTAAVGMCNLANLGIEDYMNEDFIEYANGLYNFQEIKKEMDYIRGKGVVRGKVNIKKFISGLVFYCEEHTL